MAGGQPERTGGGPRDRRSGATDAGRRPAPGVGFGGFVDGILLHQILQWHQMLSAVPGAPVTSLRGLRLNYAVHLPPRSGGTHPRAGQQGCRRGRVASHFDIMSKGPRPLKICVVDPGDLKTSGHRPSAHGLGQCAERRVGEKAGEA